MQEISEIGGTTIYSHGGAIVYLAKLDVDADGSINAYNPDDTGLDWLANAGSPGSWWGLACDENGNPYQHNGNYVSTTALEDTTKHAGDPSRYVDSEQIPYVVVPGRSDLARMGDYAFLLNTANGKYTFALCGDIGPTSKIGEASIAACRALGQEPVVRSRVRAGIDSGVLYILFPKSRSSPWKGEETADDISAAALRTFKGWGGFAQLTNVLNQMGVNHAPLIQQPSTTVVASASTIPQNSVRHNLTIAIAPGTITYLKLVDGSGGSLPPNQKRTCRAGETFVLLGYESDRNHYKIKLETSIPTDAGDAVYDTWRVYADHCQIDRQKMMNANIQKALISLGSMTNADIQKALINLGLLDTPADGKWGAQSKASLVDFQKHLGLPADGNPTPETLSALVAAKPFLNLGSDLASRIVNYMQAKGYFVAMGDRRFNIIYLEGCDPATGKPNDDSPNEFCDARLILEIPYSGVPRIQGAWEATVKAGFQYVDDPMNPNGAPRVRRKQFQAWAVGMHGEHSQHEALVQVAEIEVTRYSNRRDYFAETNGKLDVGADFAINQHWGYDYDYNDLENSSAGCLVGRTTEGHRNFMRIIKSDRRYQTNNNYIFFTTIMHSKEIQ